MRLRCIIDKDDLPKLIKGEELALTNDKISAVTIEVNGTLTNGDVIMALFPNCHYTEHSFYIVEMDTKLKDGIWFNSQFDLDWWKSPYKECDTE